MRHKDWLVLSSVGGRIELGQRETFSKSCPYDDNRHADEIVRSVQNVYLNYL